MNLTKEQLQQDLEKCTKWHKILAEKHGQLSQVLAKNEQEGVMNDGRIDYIKAKLGKIEEEEKTAAGVEAIPETVKPKKPVERAKKGKK